MVVCIAVAGCGGASVSSTKPVSPPPVSISLTPASSSVEAGTGKQTLTATVTNATDTSVTWEVNGIVGGNASLGTISAGVYTAPTAVPSPATVVITAVSVADPSKSATAQITVTPQVAIALSPGTATVQTGSTQQFVATVTNTANIGVTWQVNGTTGGDATSGTISATGLYTAPAAVPAATNVTITAISAANPTRSASATVTLTLLAQPVTVTVTPPSPTVQAGIGAQAFVAAVSNTTNTAVTWQVNGLAGGSAVVGTISAGGLYTAPASVPAGGTVTISALSAADPSRSGSATATITSPVSVAVSPPAPSVQANIGAQAFTATVSNSSNTAVTWQVNGIAGGNATVGTISSIGVYLSPATVPSPTTVTVTAVAVADPARSGSATVTITAPVSISLSPSTASVQANLGTQTFVATVGNTSNSAVTWQVNGVSGGNSTVGTIASTGVYTAPAVVPSPATVTVRAVSTADPSKSASATISVTPAVSVSLSPTSASVQARIGSQTFTATVNNSSNTSVTWKVNGVAGGNTTVGTITPGGVYTAPAAAPSPATVTVSAVAAANPTASASASVTVTPPVSVSVTPATASVLVATGTQQYTATVSNASNASVNWTVNGIAGGNSTVGTISAGGLYTAPATTPAPATVTVTAASVQDPTATGSAQATVTSTVTVTLSPRQASLTMKQSQQFTATVTGGGAVNWSVDGVAGGNSSVGTVNPTGLYTATPSSASPTPHTITATSSINSADFANGTVVVTDLDGIYTYHNDLARTGQNLHEFALTPATVSGGSFGKRWSCALDGEVYAQPLYVANVSIAGGVHNVVFIATMHDSLYAIDADDKGCTTYWQKSFLSAGVTSVPSGDTSCSDILTEVGITGTPVIDPVSQTIYLVARTKEGTNYFQRLHALDISTGNPRANSPTVITATVNSIGFSPLLNNQRPGLALVSGGIFIGWSSHCDHGSYHGWVMRYDATSLAQTAVMNVTPNGSDGAVWMSGGAPASDSTGSVFLSTGNGTFDDVNSIVPPMAPSNDFGQSFLRLDPVTLAVQDFYTPSQNAIWSGSDLDVGSSGILVLPDGAGPVAHPNLMVGADKQGHLWIIDRTQLSHFSSSGDNVVQYTNGPGAATCVPTTGCGFSTAAYWNGTIFLGFTNNPISALKLSAGLVPTSGSSAVAASQSADTYGFPGTTPMISASSATTNGIVWALDSSKNGTEGTTSGAAILRAYTATNLATKLFSSATLAADTAGNGIKFTLPVIANGHVYVANSKQLTVYGLAP